jgi:predicted nucleic acid-binding protein
MIVAGCSARIWSSCRHALTSGTSSGTGRVGNVDILIALCARRIGATVFTYDAKDFRLILRHRPFSLRILALA